MAMAANWGADDAYRAHALILLALAGYMFIRAVRTAGVPRPAPETGYMDEVIRWGVLATAFWGVVGFLAGTYIAFQLAYPELNLGLPWTTFGRLRPLHTSAVIFAFGGNALIATQLLRRAAHLRGAALGRQHRLVRVLGLPALHRARRHRLPARHQPVQGIRRARVVHRPLAHGRLGRLLAVFFGTIVKRKEPHIYVAIWFYLALHRHVAMLHVVNNLAMPVSIWARRAIIVFAGVQDALVQWWYGHNAVGFFLTRRLPRDHVLLHPEGGRPAGLFLPAVDHPLLVAGLHLHLGRAAPPALHGAARLGADARHGVLGHAVDAVLGRHDQRAADAARRLGQAAHRPGARCSSSPSASTAWRPSRGR